MSGTVHTATDQITATVPHPYHLVTPSIWPLCGAVGALLTFTGIILAAHFHNYIVLGLGFVAALSTMYVWWRDVIHESRTPGLHKLITQIGLRYGMALFITSEVMFFVSFFWNYFNYFFFPSSMGTAFAPVWPPHGHHHDRPLCHSAFQHDGPAALRHHHHLGASLPARGG